MTNPNLTADGTISRRSLLGGTALAAASAASLQAQATPPPILDCHIHLFDQTRPQGAPYSGGRGNTEPALPARYRKIAQPLGIVGVVEVDASSWVEDNLWVLETIEKDTMMVGTIGNLQPEKPEFKEFLDRYHKNKLFLGFRYGNVWGYNLPARVAEQPFLDGLKLVAQANLTFETANPRPDLIAAVLTVRDKVPDLRILVDHTGNLTPRPAQPNGRGQISPADRAVMEKNLRELAKSPNVFFKISEYLEVGADGKAVTDAAVYKPRFDYLFDLFGEDHVVFGSDWPNGNAVTNVEAIVKIARDYFSTKSRTVQEKFFWQNSIRALRWVHREPAQPQLQG